MRELMIHVERIVRPVRASAPRKLRMRQELLAHLEAALEEERAHSHGDEALAVERAKKRLGEPGDLMRELQRSVPWRQRLLFWKFPLGPWVDRQELQMARWFAVGSDLTPLHTMVLSTCAGMIAVGAMLAAVPLLRPLGNSGGAIAYPGTFFFGVLLLTNVIYALSCRFVAAAAGPLQWSRVLKMAAFAAVLIPAGVGWTMLVTGAALARAATLGEIGVQAGVALALMIVALLVARVVAVLRRPYDPWLKLDVA